MDNFYAAGTLVGHRYRIIKLLGRGGMGAVYLAEDRLEEKQVAFKSVLPSKRDEEAFSDTVNSPPPSAPSTEDAFAATGAIPSVKPSQSDPAVFSDTVSSPPPSADD